MRRWTLLLLLFWINTAHGAYRVYKLKVETYNFQGKVERVEHVLSTLDHLQYEHYHSGFTTTRVTLEDTWYCPGDTRHFRPYCPRPNPKKRGPASMEHESRYPIPFNRQPVIP